MNLLTYSCCAVIIIAFVVSLFYIKSIVTEDIKRKRNWLEQLPSLISTLGVIGTFVGITAGLIAFNPNNLDSSIPELLEGLKMAFFTSLLGMVGSIWLNRVLSKKLSSEAPEYDITQAAELIVETLNKNHAALMETMSSSAVNIPAEGFKTLSEAVMQIKTEVERMRILTSHTDVLKDDVQQLKGLLTSTAQVRDNLADLKALLNDIEQIKDDVEELKGLIRDIESATTDINSNQLKTRAVLLTATASVTAMDNNIDEMNDRLQNMPLSRKTDN